MIFEEAKWIQGDEDCESPIFRKMFTAGNIKSARITICGLGFFELYINGQKVGEDLLVPAWSNYEPRTNRRMLYPINDEFSYRTYYMEYDVLSYLQDGQNVLGVHLGNGWYHQVKRTIEGDFQYGFPKLCFLLDIVDENDNILHIPSDDTVKWSRSEIAENNIYFGEVHDLRKRQEGWCRIGYCDSTWQQARVVAAPNTNFHPQSCPADKIIRSIRPLLIYQDANRKVYDCKENISGYVILRSPENEGAEITVRYSEEINPSEFTLDFSSAGGEEQIQTDRYICSSESYLCHPKFCWYGFRYFEITAPGDTEIIEAVVVHSDIAVTSHFECSDPVLNWLYDAYIRSQLTNMHCGVPSDCPHRERLGYTGDGQVTAEACMLTLDSRSFYDKWMADIADCQDKKSGHVQHTAPFYGGGGGPGGWGSAIYVIPYTYYRHYGDIDILKKYYPSMCSWLDYMESRTENGLVVREEKGGWCLGEWCTPKKPEIPESFVNTYFYIKGIRVVRDIALLLSKQSDAQKLTERLQQAENAFVSSFFDEKTGSFCNGVNAADAFALDLELGNQDTLKALVKKYTETKTLDTGIFGTDILIDVLFKHDQAALAFKLLTRETAFSFARMRTAGATTLWESWHGGGSHNHPMFGGVVRSLFTHILGIQQEDNTAGFEKVKISPAGIPDLTWAKGYITTPKGKITVSISYEADGTMTVNSNLEPNS